MNQNRNYKSTGLIPPVSSGDGTIQSTETTSDVLRDEIETPAVLTRRQALRDCVTYLVEGMGRTDVERAINIRHNLSYKVCSEIFAEALPLAKREVERLKQNAAKTEAEQNRFDSLAAKFARFGVRIRKSGDRYQLLDLTEEQLQLYDAVLTLTEGGYEGDEDEDKS